MAQATTITGRVMVLGAAPRVPVAEGRRLLRDAEFEPQEGSANPRGEHWIRDDGFPAFVPYAPPFTGEFFDKEALDDILAGT
jgi:hypothetical protein